MPNKRPHCHPRAPVRVGRCDVTEDDAAAYLPSEYFPIDSRDELISRLLLAFEAGRMAGGPR